MNKALINFKTLLYSIRDAETKIADLTPLRQQEIIKYSLLFCQVLIVNDYTSNNC